MAQFEYPKALELLAKKLKCGPALEYKSSGGKATTFAVVMDYPRGEARTCRVVLEQYSMRVAFPRTYIPAADFDRWLTDLEFDLEQLFLTDIKVAAERSDTDYQLTLRY